MYAFKNFPLINFKILSTYQLLNLWDVSGTVLASEDTRETFPIDSRVCKKIENMQTKLITYRAEFLNFDIWATELLVLEAFSCVLQKFQQHCQLYPLDSMIFHSYRNKKYCHILLKVPSGAKLLLPKAMYSYNLKFCFLLLIFPEVVCKIGQQFLN